MSTPINKVVVGPNRTWATQKLVATTERDGLVQEGDLWVETEEAFIERIRVLLGNETSSGTATAWIADHLEDPPAPREDPPEENPA